MKKVLNIIVVDRNLDRSESVKRLALADFPEATVFAHNASDSGWIDGGPPDGCPITVVLSHLSDSHAWSDNRLSFCISGAETRICYSTVGITERTNVPDGWTAIPRPVLEASDISPSEWAELLRWVLDANRDSAALPSALRKRDDVDLAFRLLCEARVACGKADSVEIDGVSISAPVSWKDWVAPFSPQFGDDFEAMANVVALLGKDKIHVFEVLNSKGNIEDLLDAVRGYLDAVSGTEYI